MPPRGQRQKRTTAETDEAKQEEKFICANQTEIATVMNVNPRTIKDWCSQGFPTRSDDRYYIPLCVQWREQHLVKQYAKSNSTNGSDLDDLKAKKLEVEIEQKKLELMKEAGALVDRDLAIGTFAAVSSEIRTKIEKLPDETVRGLKPEIRATVLAEIKDRVAVLLRSVAKLAERAQKVDEE